MPTLPTHGAHCIYRPALARLLSSCGALRWSWSCPAQVVHPGLVPALHCQPLVTALVPALLCHSQHAALAHHSPLQEKTLHSGHAQDCCGCRPSRCHSTLETRTPHTHYCGHPGIGTAGPWTVDGGHRLEQEIHRAVIICQHANSTLTQLSRLYLIINFIWSGL